MRKSEQRAKELIDNLVRTGDLDIFMDGFAAACYDFGKYSPRPKEIFLGEIKILLRKHWNNELISKISARYFEKAIGGE